MIEKISDSVKRYGSLSASCCSLYHHNPVFRISDDGILFFLDSTDDVLKLNFSITSKLCFQNLVVDFYITLKFIDHFPITDLVLPFGSNFAMYLAHRCFIGSRSLIIIIEQPTHRSSPVIYQRNMSCFLRKVPNSNIKNLRLVLTLINEVNSSKERRIYHSAESLFQNQLFFICRNLAKQCLLVIIILITILIHFCVVLPVILMHSLDFFLSFHKRQADFCDSFF